MRRCVKNVKTGMILRNDKYNGLTQVQDVLRKDRNDYKRMNIVYALVRLQLDDMPEGLKKGFQTTPLDEYDFNVWDTLVAQHVGDTQTFWC